MFKKTFFLFFLILTIGIMYAANFTEYLKTFIDQKKSLASPLPSLLTNTYASEKRSTHWLPTLFFNFIDPKGEPVLTAVSALSYDLTTDKLLYSKEIKKKLPIASLTKIMTAIIALENEPLDKEFKVTKKAVEVGENTMGLSEGENLRLEELLYGLVLHSGNDAAETIASGSQFGRENFIYLMNKKAEELGLSNTNFTNPSGLDGDGDQYSTAYDLLVITKYALQDSTFASVAATFEYHIESTDAHKGLDLYNQTNLLTTYPGVKGVKTGYTDEAGLCLVTYLDYDGHKIIAVILNSENRRLEMIELLDYSLKSLGIKPPKHP